MVKYQNIFIRMLRNSYYNLSGKFRLLFNDLLIFPALSVFGFIFGSYLRTYERSGGFLSFQQYNLERGKVGKGWKG